MDEDGTPLALDSIPLGVAIERQEPAHSALWIEGHDGVRRRIEVTAFPLFAHANDMVGAVAIFWEPGAV